MARIRRMRATGYIAVLLILALYIAPVAQAAVAGHDPFSLKKRLLIFPFATQADMSDSAGVQAAGALCEMLQGDKTYDPTVFSRRHPSVQRAIQVERTLTNSDVPDEFGQQSKESALKIARQLRANSIVLGDVESINYDPQKNAAEVTISAIIIDVRTGSTIDKPIIAAGRTPSASKAKTESEAVSLAAGDAVTKIAQALGVDPNATKERPKAAYVTSHKSSKGKGLLLALLLGLGLGLAGGGGSGGSSSGGGGGGGGGDIPPPGPY